MLYERKAYFLAYIPCVCENMFSMKTSIVQMNPICLKNSFFYTTLIKDYAILRKREVKLDVHVLFCMVLLNVLRQLYGSFKCIHVTHNMKYITGVVLSFLYYNI